MPTFEGRFVERGNADYERARTEALFNARHPARYPAAVLEAVSEADVVAGVRLARERGWKVAARSGGHAWAAWSVRDDALLIDLGGLRELTVDLDAMAATASPSTRGGQELSPVLRRHGVVFPGGHCSTVGIGGYLPQGGQGWNSRREVPAPASSVWSPAFTCASTACPTRSRTPPAGSPARR